MPVMTQLRRSHDVADALMDVSMRNLALSYQRRGDICPLDCQYRIVIANDDGAVKSMQIAKCLGHDSPHCKSFFAWLRGSTQLGSEHGLGRYVSPALMGSMFCKWRVNQNRASPFHDVRMWAGSRNSGL